MSKYIKEKNDEKYKMSVLVEKAELEYNENPNKFTKLKRIRVNYIQSVLGEVEMTEETLEGICETYDPDECRYELTCLSPGSTKALFEITEIFPMLTKEAIIEIGKFYIKDLFEEYSLVSTLSIMLHKEKETDGTFEKFMKYVEKCADEIDKKYSCGELDVKQFLGHYSYDFVEHFGKFIVKHHIPFSTFYESLPSPELFLNDLKTLKNFRNSSRECWSSCDPISYTMLENYLVLDPKLSEHPEKDKYSYNLTGAVVEAPFTKTEFLEQIKERQKVLKK